MSRINEGLSFPEKPETIVDEREEALHEAEEWLERCEEEYNLPTKFPGSLWPDAGIIVQLKQHIERLREHLYGK